jgi:oligosaccharide repeat unit polymerase
MFFLLIFLGFFNCYLIIIETGGSLFQSLSIDGLYRISQSSTENRYGYGASSGSPTLLALSLLLIFILAYDNKRERVIALVFSFFPPILVTVLTTAKFPLFLALVFFMTGVSMRPGWVWDARRALSYLLVVIALGLVIGVSSLLLRGAATDIFILMLSLFHYIFAPFEAFGQWLYYDSFSACCTLGSETFVGIINEFGIGNRESGVYSTNIQVRGLETNIYTGWRFISSDFSIFGPLFINSSIVLFYNQAKQRNLLAISEVTKMFFVFCAFLSGTTGPFVYNSVALAVFLSFIYIWWGAKRILDARLQVGLYA